MARAGRKRKPGKREPNGRPERPQAQEREASALRTVMLARAARAGVTLPRDSNGAPIVTKQDAQALRQPWLGCPVGLRIAREPDVIQLWAVVVEIRRRRRAWLSCLDAPSDYAAGMALPVAPGDGDDTDPPRYDDRTPEERAAAAERQWNECASAMAVANPLLQRCVVLDAEVHGDVPAWLRSTGKALGMLAEEK